MMEQEDDDRPLLTQWDGGGGDDDENSTSSSQDAPSGNIFDEEDHTDNRQDVFEEDGFNLMTQSNDLFKQGHGGASDSGESGGSSSEESDDDESTSSSESSSDDDINQGEALQQRRANNIKRNEAFAKLLKLEMNAMLGKEYGALSNNSRKRKAKEVDVLDSTNSRSPDKGKTTIQNQNKRRGMLFPTKFNGMLPNQHVKQPLQTTTLAQELNANYPHRSKQIYYLCARLQSIVSRTKMAWKMTENVRSYGESYYSEASYAGRVKMSVPPPILISGPGGSGKTSIVCEAIQSLRERTNDNGGEGLPMYQIAQFKVLAELDYQVLGERVRTEGAPDSGLAVVYPPKLKEQPFWLTWDYKTFKDFRHGGREVGKYPHEFSAYRDKNTPDDGQYI